MKRPLALIMLIVFSLAPMARAQDGARPAPDSTAQSAFDKLAQRLVAAGTVEEREALLAEDKELLTVKLRRAVLALAISFFNQDKYAQSLDATNLARSIAERIGDRAGIAATWINAGLIYARQDKYALALENYRKGLDIWRTMGRQEYIADALNKIGVVYEKQGDYAQALDHYERSLKIRDEVGDKTYIAESWHNIGEIYYLQGDYEKALEYYGKSLALQESMSLTDALDQVAFAQLLHDIGIIYEEQGNYARALEYYERSVKYKKSAGIERELEGTFNNIGEIHLAQGNYRLASEYFQESLKMSRALGHRALEAQALNNIARIYTSQANYDAALKFHQDALKLDQELGNRAQLALTLDYIGSLYGATRQYELALKNYGQSLEIKEALPDRAGVAETLNHIARIQRWQHNDAESLRLAERASDLARLVGRRGTLWQARTLAGQAYVSLAQPAQARKAFEEAISTIETMRATVAGDERQQQGFFEDKVAPYLAIMELLLDQKEPGKALAYAERAKARVLLDVLQTGRINIARALTPEEQAQERALNHQLVALNKEVYQENQRQSADTLALGQLNARLEKVRLDYEALQTRLYTNHPELVTQRGEAQPLRLEEAGGLINDTKTALLEFVSTDQRTYLFVLDRKETGGSPHLKTYRLDIKGAELQDQVERYRQQLANRDLSFRETARRLYELLLKPAREQLQGKSELVIVPDAALWDLPFQALQPSDNHYLLEDYAISYAPSLTVLREMVRLRQKRSNNAPVKTTLLAFGNPATGKEPVAHDKSSQRGGQLVPLPDAEKEVNALRQLYGAERSTVYTGADAREERFKRESGNYRILHLATHSVLNDTTPLYSYILLSQDAKGESEDGLLEAREIMNLDLKADLVVLSACETARGRVGAGEGMIGLTWSLFVAGSPTLVVSQWKVESASTTQLMVEFHRLLKAEMDRPASEGSAAASALRLASLKLMHSDQYRHPFYWAGFVVVGEVKASRK
ncbi:MAG TPA: CHAT domain-containing protein [Pyrinomonadaceae bacterium]|jgi:CHAT domain-containing protein/tetratricopeptide (TPR) repeat protein|nr:CHAT domain-containing protein [Pyrinomonadaceae bacterium]